MVSSSLCDTICSSVGVRWPWQRRRKMAAALCNGRDTLFFAWDRQRRRWWQWQRWLQWQQWQQWRGRWQRRQNMAATPSPSPVCVLSKFWKTLSNFWKNIIHAQFWRHIPTYAQWNLFVFIAFLDRSHWAEKECPLSLLERTKIDRAKNQESSTSFA